MTPTATLEVILNLSPVHIRIQKKARAVTYILMQEGTSLVNCKGRNIKDWQNN